MDSFSRVLLLAAACLFVDVVSYRHTTAISVGAGRASFQVAHEGSQQKGQTFFHVQEARLEATAKVEESAPNPSAASSASPSVLNMSRKAVSNQSSLGERSSMVAKKAALVVEPTVTSRVSQVLLVVGVSAIAILLTIGAVSIHDHHQRRSASALHRIATNSGEKTESNRPCTSSSSCVAASSGHTSMEPSTQTSLPLSPLVAGQWKLELDHTTGESLGVDVDHATLRIKELNWKGLVGAWNIDNPGFTVKKGDKIVEVNGKQGSKEILAECSKMQFLRMIIERDVRPGEFRIQVDRSGGDSLGVDLCCSTLTVESVNWKGLIGSWNVNTSDPETVVHVGDKIVEVNLQRGLDKMLQECSKKGILSIAILPKKRVTDCANKNAQWTVTINRRSLDPLGFELDTDNLKVTSVNWKGLVGVWNVENPSAAVHQGDRVVEVNGRHSVSEVLKELSAKQKLSIVMIRDIQPNEWRLLVDRSSGESLGIDIDKSTLSIKHVDWKGLVCDWNVQNPDQMVQPGDKVVEVNRERGSDRILAECRKSQPLHMVIAPKEKPLYSELDHGEWRVVVDHSSGESLGLELDAKTLKVKSVSWQGLIGSWNIDHPDRSVHQGDRVVEVNGKHGSDAVKECTEKKIIWILMTHDLGPGEWRLSVDRSLGAPLGVDIDRSTLSIKHVDWKGLIGTWNIQNPQKTVKPMDQIVEVNRRRGPNHILAECSKLQPLHIVMLSH